MKNLIILRAEKMMRKALVLFALLMAVSAGYGQKSEAGLFVGGSYYNGDINPGLPFGQTKPAYGLVFRYNLDTRIAINVSASRGSLEADESNFEIRPYRNASFSSNVTDVTMTGEFNFLPFFIGSRKNKFSPYLFGGLGYYFYSGDYRVQEGIYGGHYNGSGFNMPIGIGLKYSLTRTLGLAFSWGYRKTFGDGLDGLDEFYSTDQNDPLYEVQLSNPSNNDWYSFAGVSLTLDLSIFKKNVCDDLQRNQ